MKNIYKLVSILGLISLSLIVNIETTQAASDVVFPEISSSKNLVTSGDEVTFKYRFPSNTTQTVMNMYCPQGIQMIYADVDWCNYVTHYPKLLKSQTFTAINTTSNPQNISPNFYIYTTDYPTYSAGSSMSVTIGAKNKKIESKSKAATSTLVIALPSKETKETVNPGNNRIIAQYELRARKGNVIITNFSVTDVLYTFGDSISSLELYQGNKKLADATHVFDNKQVQFDFLPVVIKKNKKVTFTIKSDIPESLVGNYIALYVSGIGHSVSLDVTGLGIESPYVMVK